MKTGALLTDITCTTEEFVLIRDFIHEQCGIYFADNKKYLVENRLTRRLQELQMKSIRDYFYHVKYDASGSEFQKLMNLITTNETSFFRNEPQLDSFALEALPKILELRAARPGPKVIRLWSAGCSTGEEPYTLGILMLEAFRKFPGWQCEIIANDISEDVLARARTGEYSGTTLRNIPGELQTRYFTRQGDMLRVKPEVRALVKFSHLNLSDSRRLSLYSDMDAIFCRNVMIYFSEEVKKELVRGFYAALRPGGYFYVGHSETLHGISKSFQLVYFKDSLVYQRADSQIAAGTTRAAVAPAGTGKNDGGEAASNVRSRAQALLTTARSVAGSSR